jgi:hypothetical protein
MGIRQHISDWKRTTRPRSELVGSEKPPGPGSAEGSVRRFSSLFRARRRLAGASGLKSTAGAYTTRRAVSCQANVAKLRMLGLLHPGCRGNSSGVRAINSSSVARSEFYGQ